MVTPIESSYFAKSGSAEIAGAGGEGGGGVGTGAGGGGGGGFATVSVLFMRKL